MPINMEELIIAVAVLADEQNIQVTIGQSAKGSLICAATSFVGGLLMGSIGLAVGGAAGGAIAAHMTKDFKPLGQVIRYDLTDQQREELFNHIVKGLKDVKLTDVAMLVALLASNSTIKDQVLAIVVSYFTKELQMKIVN